MWEYWDRFKTSVGASDLTFQAKMAAWSAVIATSFGLGITAERQLLSAEAQAQQQAEAGDAAAAIETLAEANHAARGTLKAQVREGTADAEQRIDSHLETLNDQLEGSSVSGETADARVGEIVRAYGKHRYTVGQAYSHTFSRERLQLLALREELDPDGQALVDARLAELSAAEKRVDDQLYSTNSDAELEDVLAIDARPRAATEQEHAPQIPQQGLIESLEALAGTTEPDTVATAPIAPLIADAGEVADADADDDEAGDDEAGASGTARQLDMTLGD